MTLLALVLSHAGDPAGEPGLAFTFVVGETRRAHRWDVRGGKAEVTWTDANKTCRYVVPVPYAGDDPKAMDAWAMFVNDQYWLLAPSKLDDPGTKVEQKGDDLHVSYENVGLTPGDRYVFHVDAATGEIEGWEYTLESGRTGKWTWAPSTKVGGLRLSLERTGEARSIRFEDVRSEPITLGEAGGSCS
ncbi:MAG: hypothetical protein ACOZNI_36130 [Myxococcota bacterium]